jgi:hypothetical protein
MLLQDLMDLVVVTELSTTISKMLSPVETCILNLWRKTFLYLTAFYVSRETLNGERPHADADLPLLSQY